MCDMKLGRVEAKFADLIWDNEPLSSGNLVKLSKDALLWKKSTTYTILKKLCDRGIFQNEKSVVTSIISKDDFYAMQSEQFVNETFNGSFPAFLAAFTKVKRLTKKETEEIKALISSFEEQE